MAQIDTPATARHLEQTGLPTPHARAVAEAISDAIRDSQPDWSEIATKEFVRAEIQELRAELRTEIQALRIEMQGLRTEMRGLRAEFRGELRSQMIWFLVMLVAVVGAALTYGKLFP